MSGPLFIDRWRDAVWAAELSATEKLVLLAMSRYADYEDGANCRPGALTIARDTGLSKYTVERTRRKLEGRWLLLVGIRGSQRGGGAPRASKYQLTTPLAEALRDETTGDAESPVEEDQTTGDRESPVPGMTGDSGARTGDFEVVNQCFSVTPPPLTTLDHAAQPRTSDTGSPVTEAAA